MRKFQIRKRDEKGIQGHFTNVLLANNNRLYPAANPLPLSPTPSNPKSLPMVRRVWDVELDWRLARR
ncbi:uncharacterized protein RAG0_13847 [Rhynchosporium agropyri]|uniref:Uncharacterized protein n=3 Tax=Rhynchosporium TaxID=38037 RepID=A0A1E1MNN5_RHYSE|nr:uncharacterized protein RCO7_14472 [Rhynchosporium commune]CZT08913.1 uncharacterized protein RAG0_13847 [Rhynchosporium agropyri]CZT50692.1 uncharacterized protein RSE6_11724 [Rhynchosporium secalis]